MARLARIVIEFSIGQYQQQTLSDRHRPAALIAIQQRCVELIK
jgi:hypothetical protein